jgi:hypothetical protein
MLFRPADWIQRAKFVNDDTNHVYFDWISTSDKKFKDSLTGQEMSLLEAMRFAYGDADERDIIGVDTMRYLTHIGTQLQAFVWKHKLPLTIALIVLSLATFLLLADDPRSILPKETHKWFATNSTLKKVVDAGRHWDTYYGKSRPGLQTQDLPPQGIYQQQANQMPPGIPLGADRMKFFNSAFPPVQDNEYLLNR